MGKGRRVEPGKELGRQRAEKEKLDALLDAVLNDWSNVMQCSTVRRE